MRLQDTSSSRIMIIGGGKIGHELAKTLEDDYKIKIIDPDGDRCEILSRHLNRTIVLKGAGSDEELLKSENIENIDIKIRVKICSKHYRRMSVSSSSRQSTLTVGQMHARLRKPD